MKKLEMNQMERLEGGAFDDAFWCSTIGSVLWGAAALGGPTPVAVAGLVGALAMSVLCNAYY